MASALTLSRPLRGLWATVVQSAVRWKSHAIAVSRAYPREFAGAGLLGLVAAVAIAGAAHSTPELPGSAAANQVAPPAAPPLLIRQLAPGQALEVNEAIPVAQGPNPAATPFVFKGGADSRKQALQCLASAVYYEAGSQSSDGERAVAQVVLNRVRHPAFPASVCQVVYEGSTRPTGCQFTFTCDGSLYRGPDRAGWDRAYRIAEAALSGSVYAPVGWATHYHADYVVPYWASTLTKSAVVGAHIFYRWAGNWGRPSAFTQRYSGHEPAATGLRDAALAAAATNARSAQTDEAQAVANIPGAEAKSAPPGRVAIRFNLAAARKAVSEAPHKDYADKFDASDNLRWSLSSDIVSEDEKPLGRPSPSIAVAGSATASAAVSPAPATATPR